MGLALPLLLGHPSIPTTTLITFPTILFLLTSSTTIPTTTIPTTPLASPIRCRFLYAKGLGNTLIKDFLEIALKIPIMLSFMLHKFQEQPRRTLFAPCLDNLET